MARIKKLKENGKTVYPATILDAVVDPSTNRKLSNTAIRYFTGGVSRYYKFISFDIGGDKGMIRFGIISPLLGYGEFLINWGWQGAEEEKHCYPYCVLSTGSQMYNRVKLVRTGGSTFDAYFESNSGNDYATFVFMGQSGTSVKSFSVSGVSSIPTVYRESAYVGNICFGTITGTLAGTAEKAAGISFSNNSDAIDIDRYTQGELGTIHIWLNGNQADGNVPDYPENGVVIQSHFRFENDEGEYKYRYTQMFVGKNGTLYSRTSAEGSTLGFTPSSWEEWNRSGCYYFYLGKMTVGSPGSTSTSVTFSSGSSVFPVMKALLNSYFPGNAGNHIPDIQISFGLDTSAGTQNIRAKLLSHFRNANGIDGLFFLYQNALHGGSNYLNILRITIDTSGTAVCATIDMKI